jgi:hypothetical protein
MLGWICFCPLFLKLINPPQIACIDLYMKTVCLKCLVKRIHKCQLYSNKQEEAAKIL